MSQSDDWRGIENTGKIFNWAVDLFGSALTSILLGAVFVIPVGLLCYLLRALRGKR